MSFATHKQVNDFVAGKLVLTLPPFYVNQMEADKGC